MKRAEKTEYVGEQQGESTLCCKETTHWQDWQNWQEAIKLKETTQADQEKTQEERGMEGRMVVSLECCVY